MNINEFYAEFDNLNRERQQLGMETLFKELLKKPLSYRDLYLDILSTAEDYEADDYFGTEGLDV